MERAQLDHSSERRKEAGVWKPSLRGEAGAPLAGGALADPLWSLVRQAQCPFSRERRSCGLEGYRGARGCWPHAGQGRVRVLGHRVLGLLGLSEVGWEGRVAKGQWAWGCSSHPGLLTLEPGGVYLVSTAQIGRAHV